MAILNPYLFGQLTKIFGRVDVKYEGVRLRFEQRDELSGRRHLVFIQRGEYYRMNCPFCGDTRKRLHVSHAFMTNLSTEPKRVGWFLANCFNDTACLQEYAKVLELGKMIDEGRDALGRVTLRRGRDLSPAEREATHPGVIVSAAKAGNADPAVQYLLSRNLDPVRLARTYGVGVVRTAFEYRIMTGRIYVPIMFRNKLVGWQGRYPGELRWKGPNKDHKAPPKYFTMPGLPASQILCNLDLAMRFKTIALVEGWFDVFGGVGPQGVPLLGSTMSDDQIKLLRAACPKGAVVWSLDPDVLSKEAKKREAALETIAKLKRCFTSRFLQLNLPVDVDPGSMPRRDYWQFLRSSAIEQNVKILEGLKDAVPD